MSTPKRVRESLTQCVHVGRPRKLYGPCEDCLIHSDCTLTGMAKVKCYRKRWCLQLVTTPSISIRDGYHFGWKMVVGR